MFVLFNIGYKYIVLVRENTNAGLKLTLCV